MATTPIEKRITVFCGARHFMKCRRGEKCPFPACRELQDFEKDRHIQAYESPSSAMMHYTKCREVSDRSSNGHVRVKCLCKFIRAGMKELKKEYFHESPMTLQLLAACAVPKRSDSGSTSTSRGAPSFEEFGRSYPKNVEEAFTFTRTPLQDNLV
mmetsp:Transcript_11321/g.16232  ORF Transcript_11321/g.16232 Transcript_11321/m.16232 type:complete len:155 (-) Transcript_11321:374-838(-)